jgi:hypothetical protein
MKIEKNEDDGGGKRPLNEKHLCVWGFIYFFDQLEPANRVLLYHTIVDSGLKVGL